MPNGEFLLQPVQGRVYENISFCGCEESGMYMFLHVNNISMDTERYSQDIKVCQACIKITVSPKIHDSNHLPH